MTTAIAPPALPESAPENSCDRCQKLIWPGDWYYEWTVVHGSRTTVHTICASCEKRQPRVGNWPRPMRSRQE